MRALSPLSLSYEQSPHSLGKDLQSLFASSCIEHLQRPKCMQAERHWAMICRSSRTWVQIVRNCLRSTSQELDIEEAGRKTGWSLDTQHDGTGRYGRTDGSEVLAALLLAISVLE